MGGVHVFYRMHLYDSCNDISYFFTEVHPCVRHRNAGCVKVTESTTERLGFFLYESLVM